MKFVFKLFIFLFLFSSYSLAKVLEPKTVNEFKKYLQYPRLIVCFHKNNTTPDKFEIFQATSEIHEFKNIAEVKFVNIDLNSPNLNQIPIKYGLKNTNNSCVLFFNSQPVKENESIDTLKQFSSKSNISMFIKKHWQSHIDEKLDTKYPVNIKVLKAHLFNKKVKAFLDTIAHVEGTLKPHGYRMCYTGKLFDDFTDHPRLRICATVNGKEVCSTAAGRYQFLAGTWDKVAKKIGTSNFEPKNQDLGALVLLHQADALKDIIAGKLTTAVFKLNGVWASFPDAPYGQQSIPMTLNKIKKIYNERLTTYSVNKRLG